MGLTLLERQQARWERAQRMMDMRAAGATYRECGAAAGVSFRTAKSVIVAQRTYERRHGARSPVEIAAQHA